MPGHGRRSSVSPRAVSRLAGDLMWLSSLFKRRPPQLDRLVFHVYTRRGCPLCDDAWRLLEETQRRYDFTLMATDVDTDPQLAKQYGESVPVVTVNGKVRFRGTVNRALLARLLNAEARKG